MKITFLSFEQILKIHKNQIINYGGILSIRDKNLLKSAIAQPRITFKGKFLHENIFQMAAAYLFHIVNNHPFIDGNKRTGFVVAYIFLKINKIEINISNESVEKMVLKIAQGKVKKHEIAIWLNSKLK
ncbi:MAG: Toxin Doc [Candidatus Anoxychlamydiales bacterium]|nr:Toxin Doc [Candidatus Anoxychlamydiales bacterium]